MCTTLHWFPRHAKSRQGGQNSAAPSTRGCPLCDLSGPCPPPRSGPGHLPWPPWGLPPAVTKPPPLRGACRGFKCCWLQLGGLSATPLPVGCHLQAEAGLHLHELLAVPQPVGHGQGEGCLLILQVGDLSLKRTEGLGVRGLELCGVQLSSSGHRKR